MAHHHAQHASLTAGDADSPPTFNRERHVKYHLRCLKTFLPSAYTGNDANRMMLAYFTLGSLDLLGVLESSTTPDERAGFIEWIYSCQLPKGGFRAFPGTDFGVEKRSADNESWDPANLAGTLFALLNLLMLGDGLERVKRREALGWLRRLQWEDGSFGDVLGSNGKPESGRDLRYAYIAASIRHILKGKADEGVEDVDVERLVQFVLSSQTYDGGFAKEPFHESHAGYSLCGLSILSLLGRLPSSEGGTTRNAMSQESFDCHLKWLVSRQTPTPAETEDEEEEEEEDEEGAGESRQTGFQVLGALPASEYEPAGPLRVNVEELVSAGFNGRCNKPEDTCYSFWVVGGLDVVGKANLTDYDANRHFLVGKTQHMIGGFAKFPKLPPDVMHSFFGLAALSLMGDNSFKPLATTLCVSTDISARIAGLPWRQ